MLYFRNLFRKNLIRRYVEEVRVHIEENYVPQPAPRVSDERCSKEKRYALGKNDVNIDIRYSRKPKEENVSVEPKDQYDFFEISKAMDGYKNANQYVKDILFKLDNSTDRGFAEALLNHIDSKGFKDSDVYKKAGIDRRLFSKIRSNRMYSPSKDTAIAICLALQLGIEETKSLLSRAGYTLSHSKKRDVIIEYFISKGIYDLRDINETLFSLNERIIGK